MDFSRTCQRISADIMEVVLSVLLVSEVQLNQIIPSVSDSFDPGDDSFLDRSMYNTILNEAVATSTDHN